MTHGRFAVLMTSFALGCLQATGCATSGSTQVASQSQAAGALRSPDVPATEGPPETLAALATLELVTDETTEAVGLVAAPEGEGRLFVVEKAGLIRVLRGTTFDPEPFLDLRDQVGLDHRDGGEMGLLGLAFHPDFATNRLFYIHYTDLQQNTQIEEWKASDDGASGGKVVRTFLTLKQPYKNHNAGDMAFGKDGRLYFALGDGGAADDPHGNGQNFQTKLSQLLRVDVSAASPVVEAVGNGLRNPWRISFDTQTGDLYIADVGQNLFEYVHVVTADRLADGKPPLNFGWNVVEGFHCFKEEGCDGTPFEMPYVEYDHKTGCSITGGYVYRGKALPELAGQYFYADYCTALVRSFGLAADGNSAANSWDWKSILDPDFRLARIAAFGQDHNGELYLVTHEGPIYKLVPRR